MRKSRAAILVCLALMTAVVAVGAVWLGAGGERAGFGHPSSARLDGEADDGGQGQASSPAAAPAPSPTPSQCERYRHWNNLDAGCLEPSGALTATIESQTLDTTGAHVTCELEGNRLAISVDTLERLADQGDFWAVLWGEDTHFDVLELGVGHGRQGPDGEAADSVHYQKDDSSSAPPPLAATRDGRTLTITGTRPPILDHPATSVTMTVTCPTDF